MQRGARDPSESLWRADRRALTVGLVLTITLVGFEALAISTVMPLVAQELGGLELYGWVFSAFFLGSLIGIVVVGGAIDRGGLAIPFGVGLGLFAIGLLAGGLAPSMAFLVRRPVRPGPGRRDHPADRVRGDRANAPRCASAADVRHAVDRLGDPRRRRAGPRRCRRGGHRLAVRLPRTPAAHRGRGPADARRPAADRGARRTSTKRVPPTRTAAGSRSRSRSPLARDS